MGEPGSVPSKVTVCSATSSFTHTTVAPAGIRTASVGNLYCAIFATTAPSGTTSFGLTLPWNQGLKRFRCSGIVNSKPYRMRFDPTGAKPTEAPWIVALVALLACRENVCGDPGLRRFSARLHGAPPLTGAPKDPRSALTPTYGVGRATTPPASANWRCPDVPSSRATPRPAPSRVSAPRVQSTDTSPSTLFARRL